MGEENALDQDRLGALSLRVWRYKEGEAVTLMMHVGQRLGLYEAMAGRGPFTADELATATELDARWVLEWLRGQVAAELVGSDDGDVFELDAEAAAVLADPASPLFAGGALTAPTPRAHVEGIVESFRTGRGMSYDDMGAETAVTVEAMFAPRARHLLVPAVVPALDGVAEKLAAGARVADVGCGTGLVIELLAEAFPRSRFAGYDPSGHAIGLATDRFAGSTQQVELVQAGADALPDDAGFDLVLAFDCLHDMPRPQEALVAIRRSMHDDGTLLIKDIRCSPTFEGNRRNPVLALMYATSVSTCLGSATSEPGGAGLGTLGLHPDAAAEMTRHAGFTRFEIHQFDDPVNLYYEVRP